LHREKNNLHKIIEKSRDLLSHELSQKKITVDFELEESLPLISIDEQRIEQVIINLMINAIHASKKTSWQSQVQIKVRL